MNWGLKYSVVAVLLCSNALAQISREKEIALAKQVITAFESKYPVIVEDRVIGFMDRMLSRLAQDEPLRLPIQIRVVDTSDPIASAFPGGFVVLSSGAIRNAKTEAELAGLVAHAMGHVQAGLWVRTPLRNGAGIPMIFSGGWAGPCHRSGGDSEDLSSPASLNATFDLQESQADLLGLGYLMHAGYDPQALVSVFEHRRGKFGIDESLQARAAALSGSMVSPVVNTSAFDEMKARLAPAPVAQRRIPSLYK